jgi:hypothetical protein
MGCQQSPWFVLGLPVPPEDGWVGVAQQLELPDLRSYGKWLAITRHRFKARTPG